MPQPPSTATNVSDPAAGALVPRNEVDLTGETGTEADIPAPNAKRAKKCSSDVWEHYTKYEKKKKGSDGKMITEYWAKCKKCRYESRCESVRGTSVFWNHLINSTKYSCSIILKGYSCMIIAKYNFFKLSASSYL